MGKKLCMVLGLLMTIVLVIGLTGPMGVNAAAKVKLSATKKTAYVGEQFSLELTGAKGTVTWSSSNKKVATVTDGLVVAVKTGKATIKAKDSKTNKTYKCKVTVKKNSLSDKTLEIKAGESA
nr:Ig-like domain-containing protein [Lachnospiraceae bacterium]